MGPGFLSFVRVLVRYCQSEITDHAYVVADAEGVLVVDLEDAVGRKVFGSDRIDLKAA